MIDYGQFCTVARGAEAIGDRWTLLVVRELLCGSHRFNAIHRGVPRMSASLLAQRLRSLEQVGVVERRDANGHGTEYRLTPAGEELRPIVLALGHWGARWIGGRLKKDQLDAGFLMWDISRFVDVSACPRERCIVIHFRFTDAPEGERRWWLVIDRGAEANLCRDDPGQERTVVIEGTVRALTEVWTGDREAADAVDGRALRLNGMAADRRDVWRWLGRSLFAGTRAARSSPDAGRRIRSLA